MGLLRVLIKSSIVGGVTYYTIEKGLWGKSDDSIQFYFQMRDTVGHYAKEYIPAEVTSIETPKLLSSSDISYFMKNNWNKGIMTSMQFLANLPTHTCNAFEALKNHEALTKLFETTSEPEKKMEVK